MRKFVSLLSLIALLSMSLSSCTSSDNAANHNQLVRQIVDVAANGDTKTTTFDYNGNHISTIASDGQEISFTYTNDLITRIVDVDLTTAHQNTLNYTYANGQLTGIVSSDNYVMNFVHNPDNTISYEKKTVDTNGNPVLVYHGILFFENQNLTKDERTMDDTPSTVVETSKVTYEYDAKRNPFHNIAGFTKLLNYFDNISLNNAVTGMRETWTSYLDTDQAVSSIVPYNNVYQYNDSGYPIEIVSERPVFGSGIANYIRSTFHY